MHQLARKFAGWHTRSTSSAAAEQGTSWMIGCRLNVNLKLSFFLLKLPFFCSRYEGEKVVKATFERLNSHCLNAVLRWGGAARTNLESGMCGAAKLTPEAR
ncbi:MAG TPA: hypothetical protein VGI46_17155 [Candidatus Acidoferrum sp.]